MESHPLIRLVGAIVTGIVILGMVLGSMLLVQVDPMFVAQRSTRVIQLTTTTLYPPCPVDAGHFPDTRHASDAVHTRHNRAYAGRVRLARGLAALYSGSRRHAGVAGHGSRQQCVPAGAGKLPG